MCTGAVSRSLFNDSRSLFNEEHYAQNIARGSHYAHIMQAGTEEHYAVYAHEQLVGLFSKIVVLFSMIVCLFSMKSTEQSMHRSNLLLHPCTHCCVRFPDATSLRDLVGVLWTVEVLSRSMPRVNGAAIGILCVCVCVCILIELDEPGLRLV